MMEYACRKIAEDLTIDGNLDKPQWRLASEAVLVETATGDRPVQRTGAKLLWNDRFLYVAFDCEDDYIHATLQGYNDLIYEEEVVEIFLDDDNDLKTYVEIEINPLNACLHYEVHNRLDGRI